MPKVSTTNEEVRARQPDPETRLGRLLAMAQKRASRALRAELEPFGITPVQFAVLMELYRCNGLSLNTLAERLRADPPTICGVIDCLVNAAYVERRPDPSDRRRLRLFATEKARAIESALYAADARREAAITRHLTPEECEALKDLLRRVVEE